MPLHIIFKDLVSCENGDAGVSISGDLNAKLEFVNPRIEGNGRVGVEIRDPQGTVSPTLNKINTGSGSQVKTTTNKAQDDMGGQHNATGVTGRGYDEVEALLRQVETETDTHQKGRSLEELMCRLFAQVHGFQVQEGHMITANEEIDITVLNGSEDPRFRRDAPLVLVECKNWSGKAGRPDFSAFMTKIENRTGRCTFGVMVSWNGFASTVRDERLRHSRGDILIATMTGDDVRKAIRERDFPSALFAAWQAAVAI